jgi:PadR family transcriptional regulator, regulatory protein PadR
MEKASRFSRGLFLLREAVFFAHGLWYVGILLSDRSEWGVRMGQGKYQSRTEILQGTLDLLILQTLEWGPRHGYALSKAIRTNSGEILRVDTGSLYPALHRLERAGWVAAEWKRSEAGPRLRVYRLTTKGKRQLSREVSRWERITEAVAGVLRPASREVER